MAKKRDEKRIVSHTTAIASFKPDDHNGAVVTPNVNASTFTFPKAEDGELSFGCAYGLEETLQRIDPKGKLKKRDIYARLSSPAVRDCEEMLKHIERTGSGKDNVADWALVFPSGMGALSTLVLATCFQSIDGHPDSKRDIIVHSEPLYGGTHAFFNNVVQRFGFTNVPANFNDTVALRRLLKKYKDRIGLVFCETPANPTLNMIDIATTRSLMDKVFKGKNQPVLAIDNTFMGIFQQPLALGADVVLYSATKYLGGHSDLIAGFLVGKDGPVSKIKNFTDKVVEAPVSEVIKFIRTIGGYTTSSDVAQRLWTHMETYVLRMRRQAEVAKQVAEWLKTHPKVGDVFFPTLLKDKAKEVFERQCLGHGAMIAFTVLPANKEAAYRFLNALSHCLRAVSLGCVRTLVDHPATWTHSDIKPVRQLEMGITPAMIRLSIGIEDPKDIIADLKKAFEAV